MKLKHHFFIAILLSITLSGAAVMSPRASADDNSNVNNNEHAFYVDLNSKGGEITLDDNGNVIENTNPDAIVEDNGLSTRSAINNEYGRWVFYTDGFGSWKSGYSNFYSTLGDHSSWVSMGSKARNYGYAPSHQYSLASQKGSGTFHAGYGLN